MPHSSKARDWLPRLLSLCFFVRWHMKPWSVRKSDFLHPGAGQVRYTRAPSEGRFHRARPAGSWVAGRPWRSPQASTFLMVYFCFRLIAAPLLASLMAATGAGAGAGGGGGAGSAERGSGALCCLKKARVVAAFVSDKRRCDRARGGESIDGS